MYIYNQPEISEESRVGLHHLNLDLVADASFAWRMVYNHMLMRRSVALDNRSKTIASDRSRSEGGFTSRTVQGTTLFGGELAKLHRPNKERASSGCDCLSSSYPSVLLHYRPCRLHRPGELLITLLKNFIPVIFFQESDFPMFSFITKPDGKEF